MWKVQMIRFRKKGLDSKKYSSVIQLKENPATIQKAMRDE